MSDPRHHLRDAGWLRRQVESHGSITAAAHANSIPVSTFKDAWKREGLGKRGTNQNTHRAKAARPAVGTEVSREELLDTEVRDLRAQVKRARGQEIIGEKLAMLVEEQIQTKVPRYAPAPREKSKALTTHRFFLQWSDIHAAEVVDPGEINGINSYDWDIMLRRHEKLRQSVLSFRENRPYPVDVLHIGAIGDMVTGDIHDELRVTNELVLSEAVVQLALDSAEWIEGFVPYFERITIDGVIGNHGRRSKKPQFKQAWDNWDWVFYQILKQRLRGYKSITVNVPKAAMTQMRVFDRNILLWHGDGVPTNMPGVPWGGINRRVTELQRQYNSIGAPFDHVAVGHYHEPNVVKSGLILMNGSVKGPDEYSIARFGGGADATQLLHTFHPRRGLTDTSYINLQEIV